MSQNDELKRLAESLPQLPWSYEANGFILAWDGTERSRCENVGGFYCVCEGVSNFREYLLALEPAKVLALIAENDRLERKNANQSESIREYQDLVMGGDVSLGMLKADIRVTTGERDQLCAEVAGLKTGYEAYERVNAELKAENEVLLSALKGMTSMYGHCWDLVDGGLLCMQDNVQRFEDAHEAAQKVIAALGQGEQS